MRTSLRALVGGALAAALSASAADAAYLYRKPLQGPARIGDAVDRPVVWAPTTALGSATLGVAYSRTLEAATDPDGEIPTYSVQGAMPAGLAFNPATRVVSGTPTTAGTHSFTIRAATSGAPVDQTFTLTVTAVWLGAGTAADPWRSGSGAGRASCLAHRQEPTAPGGGAWSAAHDGVYRLSLGSGAVDAFCDMGGGGWTLVGKGREGWSWSDSGQGTAADLAVNRATNAVSALSSAQVSEILGRTWNAAADGVKVVRPDNNDVIYYRLSGAASFAWSTFNSGATANAKRYVGGALDWDLTQTMSDYMPSNDCRRVFTWAWTGLGSQMGFAAGAACGSAGYTAGNGHPIIRSTVWVRQ